VRTEAKDHIEQQHRHGRILASGDDRLIAQAGVDHRVCPTAGVLIVAEIDELMRSTVAECQCCFFT
jgi:hypothetical protein